MFNTQESQGYPSIITPDDPIFWETLHTAPPPGQTLSPFYIVDSQTFELRNVEEPELTEYYLGGELDDMETYWNVA
jgi:hypothetical protein